MNDNFQSNSEKYQIKLEYADFISQFQWDLYSTITFRQKRSDGLYWSQRAFSVLEKFNATRAFVAVEPNYLEGIHLHILSRHIPEAHISSLWKYAFKAFGRTAIERVEDAMAVSRYCSKYVVKGNDFDFKGLPQYWESPEAERDIIRASFKGV